MDEREFVIQKVKDYKRLVDTLFPVMIGECWLYGSYAKGTQKKHSDIEALSLERKVKRLPFEAHREVSVFEKSITFAV